MYSRTSKNKNQRHLSPNQQFHNYNFEISSKRIACKVKLEMSFDNTKRLMAYLPLLDLEKQVRKYEPKVKQKDLTHNFFINVDEKKKNVCSIDFKDTSEYERFNEISKQIVGNLF